MPAVFAETRVIIKANKLLFGMGTSGEDYKKMLTDLIQKQMVILGPNIALDKARKVSGLQLDDAGQVVAITADPHLVLKGVANEYLTLSGQIAQMTLDTLLEKYPGIKAP